MKKPGHRIGRSRSVAELVPDIGRKAFRRFGFIESAIVARWADIVGPEFAASVTPDSLRFPQGKRADGTLTLAADGPHALMLQHVVPQIVERVNRFFGYAAVSRIAIRQGGSSIPRPQGIERGEPAPISRETHDSLKAVRDDALRASLEDLARQVAATTGPPRIG